MKKLKYIGNRKKSITLTGSSSGKSYYLGIQEGNPVIEVNDDDTEGMLATGEFEAVEAEQPSRRPPSPPKEE